MTESTPARTTPDNPEPAHGCMIDGQPAIPILISEYNGLVAQASEAEARLAHLQATSEAAGRLLARTTNERDQLRAAVARARAYAADIERSGWTGPAIARRIRAALDGAGPAATQATERDCLFRRDGCRPCNATDQCATCDRSVPQLPQFTAVHVTPEMERAATERAR